jgi:hypothetical protein
VGNLFAIGADEADHGDCGRDPAAPPDVRPSTENRDDDPGEDNAEVLCYDARSKLIHRQADCRLQILEMYYCNGKA